MCIRDRFYGVPLTVVLYRDEQGKTIPQDFLSELDPPPRGFRVEDTPAIGLEEEAPSVEEAEESPFVAQVMSCLLYTSSKIQSGGTA